MFMGKKDGARFPVKTVKRVYPGQSEKGFIYVKKERLSNTNA